MSNMVTKIKVMSSSWWSALGKLMNVYSKPNVSFKGITTSIVAGPNFILRLYYVANEMIYSIRGQRIKYELSNRQCGYQTHISLLNSAMEIHLMPDIADTFRLGWPYVTPCLSNTTANDTINKKNIIWKKDWIRVVYAETYVNTINTRNLSASLLRKNPTSFIQDTFSLTWGTRFHYHITIVNCCQEAWGLGFGAMKF